MTGTNRQAVARFIAQCRAMPCPEDVIDMARRSLVDWFASASAALEMPDSATIANYVAGWRSLGGAPTLRGDHAAAAPAALVNGALAHMLDYDDVHLGSAFHPGAPTWSAVLALGMDRDLTEADMLSAFIVGYEVGTAFGDAGPGLAMVEQGWHPTAILGHLSAAAACACLLNLDEAAMGHALGLAATQAGGLLAAGGTAAKPLHVGKAAMNGVIAAECAALGLDAPANLLEAGAPGLFGTLCGSAPRLQDLGARWRILETSFKPYPSCAFAHAPFEAARQLVGIEASTLKVFANPVAIRVAGTARPRTATEARFSIPYAAALGITGGDGAPGDFTQERLRGSALQRVMACIELVADTTIARWSSRIELIGQDGSRHQASVTEPLGTRGNPMAWSHLEAKFRAAVAPVFHDTTDSLFATLRWFGRPKPASEFDSLLARKS